MGGREGGRVLIAAREREYGVVLAMILMRRVGVDCSEDADEEVIYEGETLI